MIIGFRACPVPDQMQNLGLGDCLGPRVGTEGFPVWIRQSKFLHGLRLWICDWSQRLNSRGVVGSEGKVNPDVPIYQNICRVGCSPANSTKTDWRYMHACSHMNLGFLEITKSFTFEFHYQPGTSASTPNQRVFSIMDVRSPGLKPASGRWLRAWRIGQSV
jgi:hypothetical protein